MRITKDENAVVLWLDMLGYKNWLIRKSDLNQAKEELSTALSIAFKELANYQEDATVIEDIEVLLISDTLLCYTREFKANKVFSLIFLYQLLSIRLAKIGLPIRGALSFGSLLVEKTFPHIILGDSIVKCATLEPKINAFIVGVDQSFVDFVNDLNDEMEKTEIVSYLRMLPISMKGGTKEIYVVSWSVPWVADAILISYRLLIDRLREGENAVILELEHFIPKFINSDIMIQTLFKETGFEESDPEFHTIVENAFDTDNILETWDAAMTHAKKMAKIKGLIKA